MMVEHMAELPAQPHESPAAYVRWLADRGLLAEQARTCAEADYAWLRRGAYEIVWPVVFEALTYAIEHRRGHPNCARGLAHLEPECLDRYQDDVEATVDYLLRHATMPIQNLEGWIRSRLVKATVDGHRRRRGERGAHQRPRLSQWLTRLIGDDPWLRALAIDIMTWVGVPSTAGASLWPYSAWVQRRIEITGDQRSTESDVARDVETVLAAMRQNTTWYERYIERPLGRKQAPLLATDQSNLGEPRHLALTAEHEAKDAWLSELADLAIEVMARRIGHGEDPRSVIVEVIETVFAEEATPLRLADRAAVDRLVREVCSILGVADATVQLGDTPS